MNRPPVLMKVKIHNEKTNINLWLPLFLIFILLGVILLALSPLILLAGLILLPFGWGRPVFAAVPALTACICAMRGLLVEVDQGREKVEISVK